MLKLNRSAGERQKAKGLPLMLRSARKRFALQRLMLVGLGFFALCDAATAALTCNDQGFICAKLPNGLPDSDCVKAVTSLAIANGGTATEGWYNNGTQCGTSLKTKKPCGDKLSTIGASHAPPSGGVQLPPQRVSETLADLAVQNLPPAVDQLIDSLAALRSVHIKARVVIQTSGEEGRAGASDMTEYEYWEAGRQYRIHAYINPTIGLGEIPDLAFDGVHQQMVLQAGLAKTLSIVAQDARMVPIGIPNPLFLPL
ncbi:MAG TPA: hypothetical protein VLX28_16090, partial [Thermoanaerobaculia bacterium]|nr:hypothetical protein [Thermoanaerobaculia bacterium]